MLLLLIFMAMAGMVGTAAGLKTADHGKNLNANLLYGRRASRSGGERVVATLKLKGSTNRIFGEHEMPETLFLSAINPGVKDPTSFHFAVRDFDDALLGIGTRNEDLVTFKGVFGDASQLARSALASQIELEGVEDFDGFRAIHQRTLRNVERAVQQFLATQITHHDVTLLKSNCYSTVKYLMMPEDQEVPDRLLERHTSFLWGDPQYFNLEDWEGCLENYPRKKCLTCSEFELILTAGGIDQDEQYRNVGGRHTFELGLSKKFVKDKDYSQCKPSFSSNKRFIKGDPTELCPPGRKRAEEVAEYWNRQTTKYLPDCDFLIDTKAHPYRLSGICDTRKGHSTTVEFDFASHDTEFWEKAENSQQDFAYQDNRQYHQNNQYSSDTPLESESDSSFGGYLKWFLGSLGFDALFVCLVVSFAAYHRY
ncbi:hypothetical protein TrLO_g11700 [Triparma laevis f. longispina]|uniref:Uncharacterized protein n=1 Tax=Triparma laevis f. longispina TaxID=1714387 RepID=A0A9W7C0V4_9STRA|nr:hypothetical protein TrLO_g11700 [Triparma laevis f. longispina]